MSQKFYIESYSICHYIIQVDKYLKEAHEQNSKIGIVKQIIDV